ncbi:MAG: serine protease, partial [Bacteroidota bacterium]
EAEPNHSEIPTEATNEWHEEVSSKVMDDQATDDAPFEGMESQILSDQPEFPFEVVDGYEVESLKKYASEKIRQETVFEEPEKEVLTDAWYGSYDDDYTTRALAEVVIGRDDRTRINNTHTYPWRAICSLRIKTHTGKSFIGTGWLVGPGTVITAGHCVYMHNEGGWAKSIEVIPGRNGSHRPYGSCHAVSFKSVKGWTRSKKRNFDYGAIILPPNRKLGNQVGYFGIANQSKKTLKKMWVNLSGYPGDKGGATQWFHARRIKDVTDRTLVYDIDTAGGQSGSPVWYKSRGKRYVTGIHTNGHSSGNSATRINKAVYNNIKRWKREGM